MSNCCTPSTGFPNAASMEQMATNNVVVWQEISMIQQAIMAAASQCQVGGGQMCTTIGGNTPMTFINGVTSIGITDGGVGYYQDTPTMVFVPPNGSPGMNATGTLTTNGGNITGITVTNGGTGYQPVPSSLSISTTTGSNAILEPLVDAAGQIISVNIVNPGTGYTITDSVIATRALPASPTYTNASFMISSVGSQGEILSVTVLQQGTGYQDSVATVKIVSTLNPALTYPLGTGFMADVFTDSLGAITDVFITNTGWGYAAIKPYLVINDPGTGATTQVNLTADSVSSISVLTPGTNYTQSATGTVFNPTTALAPNPPASPAVVTINVSANTFGTTPSLYWQVWAGTVTNKPISVQLNAVLSYFKSLGYTIVIQSNPATGNTIQWRVCW